MLVEKYPEEVSEWKNIEDSINNLRKRKEILESKFKNFVKELSD